MEHTQVDHRFAIIPMHPLLSEDRLRHVQNADFLDSS